MAVDLRRYDDTAGIHFLGLVQIRQPAFLAQLFHSQQGKIHEADLLFLFPVNGLPRKQVFLISGLDGPGKTARGDGYVFNCRPESGMPAVVGPVGIDHPELSDGRLSFFRIPEIGLAVQKVFLIHGQAELCPQLLQRRTFPGVEALQHSHFRRGRHFRLQTQRFFQGRLPRINGIDHIRFDAVQIRRGDKALQHKHPGRAHGRAFPAGKRLQALGRQVRLLVKLTGQIFHGKDLRPHCSGQLLLVNQIGQRFCKKNVAGPRIFVSGKPGEIVAVNNPHRFQPCNLQIFF